MATILIVDDDVGMVETLEDILMLHRYEVLTADSGEAAVALVKSRAPDVVLMDIRMPGLNGVHALQAMKRTVPDIKVIMMTAFTRDELVEEAWRADPVAVVPKPLDLAHVMTLVQRVAPV
jgi:two-component system NtrC family response regulator/two-component system nitrogen regulation response regulator GlnG